MMKFKTTKKSMKENYNTILSIGYCNAQCLLRYEDAIAFSAGGSGWACDYYDVDNVCISTGYNPIGKKVDYDILKKYEEEAKVINGKNELTYEEKRALVHELLVKFLQEVK